MSKKPEGYVFQRGKKWTARLTYKDANGKKRDLWRSAPTENEARALLAHMVASLEAETPSQGPENVNSGPSFRSVADDFERHRCQPAQYRNGKKVAGIRSVRQTKVRLRAVVNYFGDTPVERITVASVERFKVARLNTPTRYGTERTITAVNRELEVLRAILRYAKNEGLIQVSPFERASSPLIVKAHETKRDRVLSKDEEKRLLQACQTPTRRHLYALIVAALDTGARRGELLALRWSDCKLFGKDQTITLRSETTKTQQQRVLPVSNRLRSALMTWGESRNAEYNDLVFGLRKFQNGFAAACRDAKIEGLRFHDLRATFITRLIERGMSVELVAKLSGHSDAKTLYQHYLRPKQNAIETARALLDSM
jgi:integrase